jgi:hypothetical protein
VATLQFLASTREGAFITQHLGLVIRSHALTGIALTPRAAKARLN